MAPKLHDWIALMLLQTSQEQLQVFLTAVGGMVQYAREDEAIQLQTVNVRLVDMMLLSTMSHHSFWWNVSSSPFFIFILALHHSSCSLMACFRMSAARLSISASILHAYTGCYATLVSDVYAVTGKKQHTQYSYHERQFRVESCRQFLAVHSVQQVLVCCSISSCLQCKTLHGGQVHPLQCL